MAKETKTKHLLYKRCAFQSGKHNLQAMLKSALKKKKTIGSRREGLAPDDESPVWLVIGQHESDDAFVFGLLMQYSPGTSASLIVDDQNANSLPVEHVKVPKTGDGKARELLESLMFFAVMDNHLVLMQSQALKALQLERHLQWLLVKSSDLAGDNAIRLDDHPPLATKQLIEASPVRGLVIGGSLADAGAVGAAAVEVDDRAPTSRTRTKALSVSGDATPLVDAIRQLVGPTQAAKLNLDTLDGSNIEYSLEIRYKRQTSIDGQKFMNQLGSALRHADGVETTIELENGARLTRAELRMTGPVRITTIDGVPVPSEVFEVMRSWLLQRVKSGDLNG